jgi:hypothetical protein
VKPRPCEKLCPLKTITKKQALSLKAADASSFVPKVEDVIGGGGSRRQPLKIDVCVKGFKSTAVMCLRV